MRLLLIPPLLLAACTTTSDDPIGDPTSEVRQPVVYGVDDRQDVYAFADQTWAARAAEVSPAMIDTTDIDATDPQDIQIAAGTLATSFGVCADERFASQPTAAGCSATLIAPDLVLTAGHCISDGGCQSTSYVFDFTMTDATTLHTITVDDVYACADVVVRLVSDADYAVVRLDRDVVGRTPATLRLDPTVIPNDTPLIVQGFPTTIPLKIDDGGAVRDGRPATLDYFIANLDTFGGNSGSGVYLDSGELVGILVRGEQDYVQDGDCYRVNVCASDGCSGESSTYAFRAIEALCDVAPEPGLCACGDGTCDAAGGENTATCAADCGSECGDGSCNGTETNATCAEDCPPVGAGETCANAIELAPEGTQVIDGSTETAIDDLAGSCVGGGAGDRVYTFTTTVETGVDAHVTGFDTGLYLRSACADASSELTCNDDVTPGSDVSSQITATVGPGTYALVVDGFNDNAGPYELTVTFTPEEIPDPDAGVPGEGPDAGTNPEEGDGGGCCSTGGGDAAGSGALLLLALALASSSSRRARSRRSSRLPGR